MTFLLFCTKCKKPIFIADGYNEFDFMLCIDCGFEQLNDDDKKELKEWTKT